MSRVPSQYQALNQRELRHYFEYAAAGVDVEGDGLTEVNFGEYLIEKSRLTRFQLFQALQLQDRQPLAKLGECVAALGFLTVREVEQRYREFSRIATVTV